LHGLAIGRNGGERRRIAQREHAGGDVLKAEIAGERCRVVVRHDTDDRSRRLGVHAQRADDQRRHSRCGIGERHVLPVTQTTADLARLNERPIGIEAQDLTGK